MSNEAEEFVKELSKAAEKTKDTGWLPVNAKSGPVLTVPAIEFKDLPSCVAKETRQLMIDINDSTAVVDRGPPASRGSDVVGAMRQIHTNDPRYLPTNAIGFSNDRDKTPILSGRSKTYFTYSSTNKGHTNDRKDEASLTGYVEYTAGNNAIYPYAHLSEMRIVFDYVRGRIFLSPFHYQSWKGSAGSFRVVDKPESGYPSPFFWIIEIPKRV